MVKQAHPVGNHLIDPQRIRALATGIGQTQQRSKSTGERRAEKVVDCMPKGVASKAVGYPARDPLMAGIAMAYPSQDGPLPADGSV
jgi:hypothetical protein